MLWRYTITLTTQHIHFLVPLFELLAKGKGVLIVFQLHNVGFVGFSNSKFVIFNSLKSFLFFCGRSSFNSMAIRGVLCGL